MEALLNYINALNQGERAAFAASCGTTLSYLRKAASVGQIIHPKACSLIESETAGAVTRRDLRPDDWHVIWPELAVNCKPKPAQTPASRAVAATESVAQEVANV